MAFSTRKIPTQVRFESFELTSAQAAAKAVTLAREPSTTESVLLFVQDGGGHQIPGRDFTVSGATISWNGKPLGTLLETGDRISCIYS